MNKTYENLVIEDSEELKQFLIDPEEVVKCLVLSVFEFSTIYYTYYTKRYERVILYLAERDAVCLFSRELAFNADEGVISARKAVTLYDTTDKLNENEFIVLPILEGSYFYVLDSLLAEGNALGLSPKDIVSKTFDYIHDMGSKILEYVKNKP